MGSPGIRARLSSGAMNDSALRDCLGVQDKRANSQRGLMAKSKQSVHKIRSLRRHGGANVQEYAMGSLSNLKPRMSTLAQLPMYVLYHLLSAGLAKTQK